MSDPGRNAKVTLREITGETVRTICRLKVSDHQKGFVAENAVSIAEAYFQPKAWFRAIYADETPVGFVMLYDSPEEAEYYLWRYMIDGRFQGCDYGRQALEQVIDYVRTRPGADALLTSCVPGEGSPMGFYRKLGFEETGVVHGEEKEMKLALA